MRTHSKIALKLFLINLLIILLFGGSTYYFFNRHSYVDFYKRLETRAKIAARYNFESDRLSAKALIDLKNQHLEILDEEKEYVLSIPDPAAIEAASADHKLSEKFLREIIANRNAQYRSGNTLYAGLRYDENNTVYLVIVSANNSSVDNQLGFLKNVMMIGGLIIVLFSVYISLYISRTIFIPIKNITTKVRSISANSMHLRLEDSDNNREIAQLISTFNELLDRIETIFETQKNFVSNASHELSTPLTAIIGEIDVTLLKARTTEEYKEVLKRILDQADRLDNITRSLLFLAQTGFVAKKTEQQPLRIDELVWEVKQTIDKINPANQIAIDHSLFPEDPSRLTIRGNQQLLHLALANILSNACKYSSNKPVKLSIATTDTELIIMVTDDGVGIPKEELPFIYDPFFRASNTNRFEGYGIGLPLTRNIIRLHHGKLTVHSEVNKGTSVEIRLPLVSKN